MRSRAAWPVFTAALALTGDPGGGLPDPAPRNAPVVLSRVSSLDRTLERSGSHRYTIPLRRGESAEISVLQQGVDVVVELYGPAGEHVDSVDGPTGRILFFHSVSADTAADAGGREPH